LGLRTTAWKFFVDICGETRLLFLAAIAMQPPVITIHPSNQTFIQKTAI
jgi:hypothetical protein